MNGQPVIELVGRRFGRLLVMAVDKEGRTGRVRCVCDCGNAITVYGYHLKQGKTKSCGCFRKEFGLVHGHCKVGIGGSSGHSAIYAIWAGMKSRCSDSKSPVFKHYGGRGITVCERWLKFENFYADMGERPEGLTIDRINNNGNYEPGNCRWATMKEQSRNRRGNRLLTYQDQTKTLSEWADELGILPHSLLYRHQHNPERSIEDMLTTPFVRGVWRRKYHKRKQQLGKTHD